MPMRHGGLSRYDRPMKPPRPTARRPERGATEPATPTVDAPPVPSGVTGSWFPALVVLPGQRSALSAKTRVYATPEGLYVYTGVPQDQAQLTAPDPAWFAPIAYGETEMPPANYSARARNGFVIQTTKGAVTITVPRGCPVCGMRRFAEWQPTWAHSSMEGGWKA